MFKEGDLVKKTNGSEWSNGEMVATVSHIEGRNCVYVKETGTWMLANDLVLVESEGSPIQLAIELLESKLLEVKSEEANIESAIKVLKIINIYK